MTFLGGAGSGILRNYSPKLKLVSSNDLIRGASDLQHRLLMNIHGDGYILLLF